MRLRTANNRHKARIRRELGQELWPPPRYRHEYARAWKRFERNAEGIFVGAYCFGCRGHPGIVTAVTWDRSSPYGSDCEIKSLVDGIEESCSIFHCAPDPTTKEEAEAYADYMQRHGSKMATIKFFPNSYKAWEEHWNDPEHKNSYKTECTTLQEYLGLNDAEFRAYRTGELPA